MFGIISKMRMYLYLLFMALCLHEALSLNEAQMKAAVKLIRNTCRSKTKVTDDLIENMHKGVWDGDPGAKCYAYCAMTMMKLSKKDGAFDADLAAKQIPQLPESVRDIVSANVMSCKNADTNFDDKCDISYEYMKCLYNASPEYYIFP